MHAVREILGLFQALLYEYILCSLATFTPSGISISWSACRASAFNKECGTIIEFPLL